MTGGTKVVGGGSGARVPALWGVGANENTELDGAGNTAAFVVDAIGMIGLGGALGNEKEGKGAGGFDCSWRAPNALRTAVCG